MPIRDPKRRAQVNKTWRKQKHTPGYMKWLYAKRMVPKEQARIMRQALERLASAENLTLRQRQEIAYGALEWCRQHEKAVGNRYNHETERPYFKPPNAGE